MKVKCACGETIDTKEIVHCSRCGRELKNPKYVDGIPYGCICVNKIDDTKRNVEELF